MPIAGQGFSLIHIFCTKCKKGQGKENVMVRKKLSGLNMLLVVGSAIVASLLFFGCGGGGGGSSSQSGNGTLSVSLTDAPAGGFDAVNVTVSKVRVHQSDSATEDDAGWTDITLSPARKINLLNLTNGVLEELGETPLAAGHYTQLRLVLVPNSVTPLANSVVLSGTTTEIPLDTPSGVQSGIKLIHQFDVAAGQRVDLVLDFDASKSVVKAGASGKYLLKPVIKVIPTALNGIDGFVDTFSPGSNVSVSAQQDGTVIGSTVPNTLTGEFFIARLAPGNYDVVFTADGRTTKVIASVPVASTTSITVLSTSAEPITLPLSTSTPTTRNLNGVVTLNPASSIDEAAFVAAKQTFGSSPTVTVKSQAVDVSSGSTGAYSLTLPIDAPLLGQYGTGSLPITFTAQTTAAGKYNVEASFTGYVTQSANIDISAADATQNFTLVP
jgi:hypothetical protein